jgi:hypothetical protein
MLESQGPNQMLGRSNSCPHPRTRDEAIMVTKKARTTVPREIHRLTDRECVMAKCARQIGAGLRRQFFFGTRHANQNFRTGKLICSNLDWGDFAICFSRSPETAAYFAYLRGDNAEHESRAVLVLNRSSLIQNYRLEPFRDDCFGDNCGEREERIIGRNVSFRRNLIGVVRDAYVAKVLGCLPSDYYSWPRSKILASAERLCKQAIGCSKKAGLGYAES